MEYLHYFETQSAFNTAYNGSSYKEPWLSYTEGVGVGFSKPWPEVTILTKTSQAGGVYKYTTNPGFWNLIPEEEWYFSNGYSYRIYFNGTLYTNDAKSYYTPYQGDTGRLYLRMSSNSNDAKYNYYFYATADDYGISDLSAIFPDSFGSVGDKIKVRIERK